MNTPGSSADWSRALSLLTEMQELEAGAGEALLGRIAAEEPLVAELLARLLNAQKRLSTSSFLSELPHADALHNTTQTFDRSYAGEVVGDFVLESRLGSGGMGTVWRAHYRDGRLSRAVAIKRPNAEGAAVRHARQVGRRLQRERDLLTTLDHPNIARLLDAGLDKAGQPFLALELVQGVPIHVWADSNQLPIAKRVGLVIEVLDAVAYAHQHLVIHRDIKPANILVNEQGGVKLLDFGVAKLLSDPDSGASALGAQHDLTLLEQPAMTLAYAAPEQIKRLPLTTACDVYACGVLLYELLTALSPHQPSRPTQAALEECILHDAPVAPSRRKYADDALLARRQNASALSATLRGDLDVICQKALQTDVRMRYASALEMASDLRLHLRGLPIAARADRRLYVLGRFFGRYKWQVTASALAVLGLLLATGMAAWQARVAQQNLRLAERASSRANAAQQFFVTLLAGSDPLKNRMVNEVDRKVLERAFASAQTQFVSDPETLSLVLEQIGEIYFRQNMNAEFLAVTQRRLSALEASRDIPFSVRAAATVDVAKAQWVSSNQAVREQALQQALRALPLAEQGDEPTVLVDVLTTLALFEREAERLPAAQEHANKAVALADKHLSTTQVESISALSARGLVRRSKGDLALATADLQLALQRAQEGRSALTANHFTWFNALIATYFDSLRFREALDTAEQTLDLADRKIGDAGDLLLGIKLYGLAAAIELGESSRAAALVQKHLGADVSSSDSFRAARAQYALAMLADSQRDFPAVRKHLDLAKPGFEQSPRWRLRVQSQLAKADLLSTPSQTTLIHITESLEHVLQELHALQAQETVDHQVSARRLVVAYARLGQLQKARVMLGVACSTLLNQATERWPDEVRCQALGTLLEQAEGESGALERYTRLLQVAQQRPNCPRRLLADLSNGLRWMKARSTDDRASYGQRSMLNFPLLN